MKSIKNEDASPTAKTRNENYEEQGRAGREARQGPGRWALTWSRCSPLSILLTPGGGGD
jgi:hypothetical protein